MSHDQRVMGKRLVSSIVGIVQPYCLGNTKLIQLACRRNLTLKYGCNFDSLRIQPITYMLNQPQEISALFNQTLLSETSQHAWLLKKNIGQGGLGIQYFPNTHSLLQTLKKSSHEYYSEYIAQEYISQPALLSSKYKFDIRTWLLVLSVNPLVLFSHDGFGRVAKVQYSMNSTNRFAHITNLDGQGRRILPNKKKNIVDDDLIIDTTNDNDDNDDNPGTYLRDFTTISQQLYKSNQGFPPHFMETKFREQIDHAHIIAALAQFQHKPRVTVTNSIGFFHLFACDSIIESNGHVYLLECNGTPAELENKASLGMWNELSSLILNFYLDPSRLLIRNVKCPLENCSGYWAKNDGAPMDHVVIGKNDTLNNLIELSNKLFKMGKYQYGGWRLLFNELEMKMNEYNVCKVK
jgi:hypothetical protein